MDSLLEENRKLSQKLDVDVCELKVSYSLKSKELERKTLELENLKIQCFNQEQENKAFIEKNEILRAEIFKIKSQGNEEISQVKAENLVLR